LAFIRKKTCPMNLYDGLVVPSRPGVGSRDVVLLLEPTVTTAIGWTLTRYETSRRLF
jgi:hypothetical protein